MSDKNGMRAVHPGEVLRKDYLIPMGMSANALAKAMCVPAPRINDILLERRGITAHWRRSLVSATLDQRDQPEPHRMPPEHAASPPIQRSPQSGRYGCLQRPTDCPLNEARRPIARV